MKPATHDFDVITDAPTPKRHLVPETAEKAPQLDAEEARGSAAPPERAGEKVRAAE
jgi:hypothetical protein